MSYSFMAYCSVASTDELAELFEEQTLLKSLCDSGVPAIPAVKYPQLCRTLEIVSSELVRRAYQLGLTDHITPSLED